MKNLSTILPFYDSLDEQVRFRDDVDASGVPMLIAPADIFIPWVIRRPHNSGTVADIELYFVPTDPESPEIQIHGDDAGCNITSGTVYDLITFPAYALPAPLPESPSGYYLRVEDGAVSKSWFSDVFSIRSSVAGYNKLEFYNNNDLGGIPGKFPQAFYFDPSLRAPEYSREDTGDRRDGVIVLEKQVKVKMDVIRLHVSPEYLIDAMMMVPMMDHVTLTLPNGDERVYDELQVKDPEWIQESFGALANLELRGLYDVVIKKLNFKEMIYPAMSTSIVKAGGPVATSLSGDAYIYQVVFDADMPDTNYTPAAYLIGTDDQAEAQLPTITNITIHGFRISTLVPAEVRWTAIRQ